MRYPVDRISLKAPAKINLYLKITGRREDGYHYLATLMQKISLFDQVDLEKIQSGVQLTCPGSDLPENDANLAFRAGVIFLEKMQARLPEDNTGVAITLGKSIPVAAGLGGGSSDAAAVLKGLDQLFGTKCSEEELMEMGVLLGADVPFFIADQAVAWATGIGDKIYPAVPLSDYMILVVNPGFSVSTQWVYENFALTVEEKNNTLEYFEKWQDGFDGRYAFATRPIRPDELDNDLEQVTALHYKEIEQLKMRLHAGGAVTAMMTGSGPTVFGLFRSGESNKAADFARELKRDYRNTFLVKPLQG